MQVLLFDVPHHVAWSGSIVHQTKSTAGRKFSRLPDQI